MGEDLTGVNLGIWKLEERIGRGGSGDVYRARRIDNLIRQMAAVKILRNVRADSVRREATIAGELGHKNIVRCLATGETDDGRPYLVMEYVDGATICDYSDQMGLSIPARLRLFADACDAVEYAHEQLVVHLDLKPSNILVNREGMVKLIDFGLAQRVTDDTARIETEALSRPYASPEQLLRNRPHPGYPSDIYSLGTVLYELLCGRPPFNPRLSPAELERQIIEEPPAAPSLALSQPVLRWNEGARRTEMLEPKVLASMRGKLHVSDCQRSLLGDLDRICLHALEKAPRHRYRSVADFAYDVRARLEGRSPRVGRPHHRLRTLLGRATQYPMIFVAAAAVFTVVMAVQGFRGWLTGSRRESEAATQQYQRAIEITAAELRGQILDRLPQDPNSQKTREAISAAVASSVPRNHRITILDRVSGRIQLPFFDEREHNSEK